MTIAHRFETVRDSAEPQLAFKTTTPLSHEPHERKRILHCQNRLLSSGSLRWNHQIAGNATDKQIAAIPRRKLRMLGARSGDKVRPQGRLRSACKEAEHLANLCIRRRVRRKTSVDERKFNHPSFKVIASWNQARKQRPEGIPTLFGERCSIFPVLGRSELFQNEKLFRTRLVT